MKYKVLTLTQPWATLVAIGAKRIETRSWATSHRGPLLIHAAAGLGPVGGRRAFYDLCYSAPFHDTLLPAMTGTREIAGFKIPHVDPMSLPMGSILALVDVVSMHRITADGVEGFQPQPTAREIAFGDYTPGRYGWLLSNVRPLAQPITARGALGLWTWDGEIAL